MTLMFRKSRIECLSVREFTEEVGISVGLYHDILVDNLIVLRVVADLMPRLMAKFQMISDDCSPYSPAKSRTQCYN